MPMTFTSDDFKALGRQLIDLHIARFAQALVDHASTVDAPAPTDHPLIESIVRKYDGKYTVADSVPDAPPRDFGSEIDALKAVLVAKAVVTKAELAEMDTPVLFANSFV